MKQTQKYNCPKVDDTGIRRYPSLFTYGDMKLLILLKSLIRMSRPGNLVMSIAAVALGFWLSFSTLGIVHLILLMVAAAGAVGFGNIINDVCDIESDRISHPDRPLVKGDISRIAAVIFSIVFLVISIGCGFSVSRIHGIATVIPALLLFLYAIRLKRTPLIGNIIISILVSYPLIFGAIGSLHVSRLLIPALLAFLLNLCREIVKDIQDAAGDTNAGFRTTASLPPAIVQSILGFISLIYLAWLFAPKLLGYFGWVYVGVCVIAVVPLHLYRLIISFPFGWLKNPARISLLLKLEMLAGLAALALDQLYTQIIR
jgi:geranylgeranylglycerol-phosphate geranylgeranyltransferase